jgi:RHS repeat-associated protein
MSYDRMGRRVAKNNQRFIYDGYLCIGKIEDSTSIHYSLSPIHCFVWDPTEPVATRPLAWLVLRSLGEGGYYTHDGNKNVSEVMASDGAIAAHYEYAPFGFVTVQRGESVMANPWRFSSEYAENETETVYYNYRHYNPNEGRWVYRDLFENLVLAARLHPWRSSQENLYSAVNNRTSFAVDALGLTDVVSDQEFPGAHQVRNKWWLSVDDGQNGKVRLIRYTRDKLRDEMRSAAIQLCIYQRDDWIPTRAYEGGFDTGFFKGENKQHSYYYIEGESQIWADNEVNYIGIGMYEAWLGSPKWLGSATIVLWKVLRWWTLPTHGTFYWYNYGYDNFDSYYSKLDKCTCKPKDGSSWYYDESTYSAKRPGGHRNSRFGR